MIKVTDRRAKLTQSDVAWPASQVAVHCPIAGFPRTIVLPSTNPPAPRAAAEEVLTLPTDTHSAVAALLDHFIDCSASDGGLGRLARRLCVTAYKSLIEDVLCLAAGSKRVQLVRPSTVRRCLRLSAFSPRFQCEPSPPSVHRRQEPHPHSRLPNKYRRCETFRRE
jgi:hypothetical protein